MQPLGMLHCYSEPPVLKCSCTEQNVSEGDHNTGKLLSQAQHASHSLAICACTLLHLHSLSGSGVKPSEQEAGFPVLAEPEKLAVLTWRCLQGSPCAAQSRSASSAAGPPSQLAVRLSPQPSQAWPAGFEIRSILYFKIKTESCIVLMVCLAACYAQGALVTLQNTPKAPSLEARAKHSTPLSRHTDLSLVLVPSRASGHDEPFILPLS